MLPSGDRLDTITYRLLDAAGMIRGAGLKTEEAAVALGERLLESPGEGPFVVERTTFVSFTHREPIRRLAAPEMPE